MSADTLEEIKTASSELSNLTASAKKMLTTFDARIRTLAEHKQLVSELSNTILRLKKEPNSKADTSLIKLILSRIKNDILPPFALVNPQIADIITYTLSKVREKEIIDIEQIGQATKGIASEIAKKRLLELQNKFTEHIKKIGKDITLAEHLNQIITLANQHARKQQELIAQEYRLIKNTENTINSQNDHNYDSIAHEWNLFIEELDGALKEENNTIIKQIDFLFEEDHSVASKIKQRLKGINWIGKRRPTNEEIIAAATRITEADIAEDLETLTTSHEISEYISAMMREAHNLTPEARRYLSVQGEIKAKEAQEKERNLTKHATRDALTGLLNRRAILELIEKEIAKSQRTPKTFSVLYTDIDHFKKFNDNYGHAIGDAVLRHVANVMQKNVRASDFVGRLGGEEFCVFMPDTDKEGAARVAEKIREAIQISSKALMDGINTQTTTKNTINQITISTGVSTYPEDGILTDQIFKEADTRLYKAKESGRNRVITA